VAGSASISKYLKKCTLVSLLPSMNVLCQAGGLMFNKLKNMSKIISCRKELELME
jgi:hypothetical protein